MPIGIDERAEVVSILDTVRDIRRTAPGRYVTSGDVLLATLVHRIAGAESLEALRAIAFETHVAHHPSTHRPDDSHPAHQWGGSSELGEEEDD